MGVGIGVLAGWLGTTVLLGGAATAGGMAMSSANQEKKAAANAKRDADNAAKNQDLGNLTGEEASASASKKMFRQGLYFTSPTGLSGSGTRGRSRLMGK